jgi:hypothetical protein
MHRQFSTVSPKGFGMLRTFRQSAIRHIVKVLKTTALLGTIS